MYPPPPDFPLHGQCACVDGSLFFGRLIGRMQEMQEEKRALRAEVAAEQAETEQLRLLVRVCRRSLWFWRVLVFYEYSLYWQRYIPF